uniref:Rho GTPase activating protein 4 n=1 Tax=Naja naja TaxID=35670 RepID=A0A8C6YHX9_NAJNA
KLSNETPVLQTFLSAIICASLSEMRWQMGEQVRGLDSQAESRQQLLQDVADFLRRKAEVEQEYSRGLEKLSERFSAKIRGSKEHQNFRKDQNLPSPLNCWYTILNQTRQASRDHGALSEIYTGHLVLRLVHISEDVGRLARKVSALERDQGGFHPQVTLICLSKLDFVQSCRLEQRPLLLLGDLEHGCEGPAPNVMGVVYGETCHCEGCAQILYSEPNVLFLFSISL